MPVGHFLVGIAALVYDPKTEKYLLLRRADTKDVGAGSWECPTGRVDQGESIEAAMIREVREELGVDAHPLFIIGTTHFYRGAAIAENELVGLIYACAIAEPGGIRISDEHSDARWMSAAEVDDFLEPGHWLRWVIRRAEQMRAQLPQDLLDLFVQEGFEVGGRNTYR